MVLLLSVKIVAVNVAYLSGSFRVTITVGAVSGLFQMLARCLLECYNKSVDAGSPLALRVFVSGRGRLEDEGSTALAEAFKVRVSAL